MTDTRKKSFRQRPRPKIRTLMAAGILFLSAAAVPAGQTGNRLRASRPPGSTKISHRLQARMLSPARAGEPAAVWIYLRDKGRSAAALSRKKKEEIRRRLRPHCLWRRGKVRGPHDLVDVQDAPLHQGYIDKIVPEVERLRTVSRWLNALSAEITAAQLERLESCDFIVKIDLVTSFRRSVLPSPAVPEAQVKKAPQNLLLDYGSSFDQLDQMNVIPLHERGYSGESVVVCILDSGFRKSHEAFRQARIIAEWDFVNNDGDVAQDPGYPGDYPDSHGTGTWSALGGYKPGELIGPAYRASFILGKTESTLFEQPIEEDYWVAGMEWAEALGAEIVSSSLGYTDWYTFQDMDGKTAVTTIAANRATSLGVTVVNAAGNERQEPWGHIIAPADGLEVIAVGAVDRNGMLAPFSSPGPSSDGRIKPDVCARGLNTWIAGNNAEGEDIYRMGSGTSFATPLIAGAAALLLEIHRDWTPEQVSDALAKSGDRSFKPDNDYGWGVVDAELAASWDQKKRKKGAPR